LGYRLPAEWEPHEATWLAWPQERGDWPGKFGPIPWVYAEIVRHLVRSERVRLVVPDREGRRRAEKILRRAGVDRGRIRFVEMRTDRSWLRDTLPSFVLRQLEQGEAPLGDPHELSAVVWRFDGWAKYANHKQDQRVARRVAKRLGLRRFKPSYEVGGVHRRVVLEGGAIDGNGQGVLLTTEECLLDTEKQVRNPGLDRAGYERIFAEYLGITKTIWLGRGIVGDDTHGHVDDVARFVNPRTVVVAVEPDPGDPNNEPLRENRERLRSATDLDGRPLEVVELPMPAPVVFEGVRLPASYANFYIANRVVLVPTFNDPNDRVALNVLAELFPDREVVGIHSVDLVLGLGTLHCLAHEQPAVSAGDAEEPAEREDAAEPADEPGT
jgi:agmatine deiminase